MHEASERSERAAAAAAEVPEATCGRVTELFLETPHVHRAGIEHPTGADCGNSAGGLVSRGQTSVAIKRPVPRGNAHSLIGPRPKKTSVRPSKNYFLTLDLLEINGEVRSRVVGVFDSLVSYCVGLESSRVSSRVSYHLHCYFEFKEPMLFENVRSLIVARYPGVRFDLQACKSVKNVLKYITKEDRNPYFNVKLSSLHFNYRSYVWAKSTDVFRFDDPFVMEHRFCYRFLQKLYEDVKYPIVDIELPRCVKAYQNWTLDVCVWWNKMIKNKKLKQKQLYLYGPSNVGKSSYVEMMIGRNNLKYVFYPGVGKFFMQGFKKGFHRVILFEEFSYKFAIPSMLKRLLEGRKYAYSVKCEADLFIEFNGPIIFVSNELDDSMDEALRNRLLFISATHEFWTDMEALLPKEEESEEEQEACDSCISLLSEEESDKAE